MHIFLNIYCSNNIDIGHIIIQRLQSPFTGALHSFLRGSLMITMRIFPLIFSGILIYNEFK